MDSRQEGEILKRFVGNVEKFGLNSLLGFKSGATWLKWHFRNISDGSFGKRMGGRLVRSCCLGKGVLQ